MNKYLIVFSDEQNSDFINKIKSFGSWARLTNQAYAIVSDKSSIEIRNDLKSVGANLTRLIVIDISDSSWASLNLPVTVSSWMKNC